MNNISGAAIFWAATALLLLITVKTILLKRATRHRNLAKWFFFNKISIIDSSSATSRRYKLLQNVLSVAFFAVLAGFLLYLLLSNP